MRPFLENGLIPEADPPTRAGPKHGGGQRSEVRGRWAVMAGLLHGYGWLIPSGLQTVWHFWFCAPQPQDRWSRVYRTCWNQPGSRLEVEALRIFGEKLKVKVLPKVLCLDQNLSTRIPTRILLFSLTFDPRARLIVPQSFRKPLSRKRNLWLCGANAKLHLRNDFLWLEANPSG